MRGVEVEAEDISFRRLTGTDAPAVTALSKGVWWMETRSVDLVVALLDHHPAMRVYGVFRGGERLVATAALLTDGLTKAILVDVAVAEDCRGEGLGDEVVARTIATAPDAMEGILYCLTGLVPFYEDHGFAVDPAYALMLRRL